MGVGEAAELDPRRHWVMALFVVLTTNQVVLWFTFASASSPGVAQYYRWGNGSAADARIDMHLAWGPIGGLLAAAPAAATLSRPRGLRGAIVVCAILQLGCCLLRLVPSWRGEETAPSADVWLQCGSLLNALAGPFIMGSCSTMSATWYAPAQRGTATAVAFCGGSFGGAVGYILGPLVIADRADRVYALLLLELGLTLVPCAAVLLLLPAGPAYAPREQRRMAPSWGRRLLRAVSHRSVAALALIAGLQAGANSAWGSLFPQLVHRPEYASYTAGLAGCANGLLQTAGNLVGGRVADVLFRRRLRRMIGIAWVAVSAAPLGFSAHSSAPERMCIAWIRTVPAKRLCLGFCATRWCRGSCGVGSAQRHVPGAGRVSPLMLLGCP